MDVRTFGPVSDSDVAVAEAVIGSRLPESYRSWLLASGGAKVHDLAMPAPGGNGVLLEFLAPIEIGQSYRRGFAEMIPSEFVRIGSGAGGAVCIKVNGDDIGAMYWADYDKGEELFLGEDETSEEMMLKLAPDWDAFLASR